MNVTPRPEPPAVLLLHEFGGPRGGAEVYLERLGRGIAATGGRVAALTFAGDAEAGRHHVEGFGPVEAEVVAGRATPWRIAAAVRRHRPEILHWNFCDPFSFRGATFTMLPWGRPSVITDHLPMLTAGRHYETTRPLADRRLGAVIVVGQGAADAYREHWGSSPDPVVVPNGVPLPEEWAPRDAPERGAPLRLLFVGRLTDQKRPEVAVHALTELPAATLTVVGEGPLAGELRSLAQRLGVHERVILTGRSDEVGRLMADHHVMVAPAAWEGLPLTPIEAMATGLPVVASAIDPHLELADPERRAVELVDGTGASDWAAAVLRVTERLPAASSAARAHAAASSVEAMVERTIALHREVLRGR